MGFPTIKLSAHARSVVFFLDCSFGRRLDLDIVYIGTWIRCLKRVLWTKLLKYLSLCAI